MLHLLQPPFPLKIHFKSVLSIQFQRIVDTDEINVEKAHRGVRPHHLRVSVPLPEGLPP